MDSQDQLIEDMLSLVRKLLETAHDVAIKMVPYCTDQEREETVKLIGAIYFTLQDMSSLSAMVLARLFEEE